MSASGALAVGRSVLKAAGSIGQSKGGFQGLLLYMLLISQRMALRGGRRPSNNAPWQKARMTCMHTNTNSSAADAIPSPFAQLLNLLTAGEKRFAYGGATCMRYMLLVATSSPTQSYLIPVLWVPLLLAVT